jgi:ABC-type nitrate/sulfonate/bicarbonate transport system permease component
MLESTAVQQRAAALPPRIPREAIVSLLVIAAIWQALSYLAPTIGIPQLAFPSFVRIANSLTQITFADVAVTLMRVVAALVVSFALGTGFAVLCYVSKSADRYLTPVVRLLMAIPVISWILFAILWFRSVEFRILFVLVVTCGPIFFVDLLDSMHSTSKELRDMMKSFRPTLWQFFTKLMLPASMPSIITSWKINLSLAIRVVTIAELVGAVTGIGHQLAIAQELFSVADVFAWTLTLVVILFVLEALLNRVETHVLRWRQ